MKTRITTDGLANPHATAWTDTLSRYQTAEVDALGSINEDGINYILAKHFQYDNQRYTLNMQKSFNVNGTIRTFTLTLTANSAFKVTLPPFPPDPPAGSLDEQFDNAEWSPVDPIPASSRLTYPPITTHASATAQSANPPLPNIRVYCPSVTFTLGWPRLDGTKPDWSFTSDPFSILAEAIIELESTSDGTVLHLQLVKAAFQPTVHLLQSRAFQRFVSGLSESDKALISADDQKFQDLLIIALNVAANIYAPRMVYDLKIPVVALGSTPIYPSLLDVTLKTVVVGVSLNRQSLANATAISLQRQVDAYLGLVNEDIQKAGGMEAIVVKERKYKGSEHEKVIIKSKKEIESAMPLSTAFLASLKRGAGSGLGPKRKRITAHADVPGALAIGTSQLLLTRIVTSIIPAPVNNCTDWAQVLDLVRGRACYWVRFSDPAITISGTSISGAVNIDIGGSLDGCVRKFWNCSWSWDCNSLSLALVGRPGITLQFSSGTGVSFKGQLTGTVSLETNLPWPFGDIVSFLANLIIGGILAIVNAVVGMIQFDILLPKFQLPEQHTILEFVDVTPFSFVRSVPPSLPPAEQTFIGFLSGLSSTHK